MSLAVAAAVVATGVPLALPGYPSVRPWPVGPGPGYRPVAAPARVRAGGPLGSLRCTRGRAVFQLHLELFANRRVVVVPAGIGVARPLRVEGASVVADGCTYPISTRGPAGIVDVARGVQLRLASLFSVWGERLGSHRLGSFRSSRVVRAYVGGRRFQGPPGSIPLTPHAEIVLELGGYVVPHRFFLFSTGTQ